MDRHVAFWLGAFAATAVVVTVAIGAWSVATERALSLVSMAVGGIIAITMLLGLAFFLRRYILKKALNVSESSLQDVSEHAAETFYAIVSGDVAAAKTASAQLSRVFVGWWAWSNFYRWVITTNIAFLVAFGGFAGTVLLFEQNKRLQEQTAELIEQRKELQRQGERFETQNELLGLNLTSNFRERLRGTSLDPTTSRLNVHYRRESCGVQINLDTLQAPPNPSEIASIAQLASSDLLGEKVTATLLNLARDSDPAVRLGAIISLDQARKLPLDFSVDLEALVLEDIAFSTPISLRLQNVFASSIACNDCEIDIIKSVTGIAGSSTITADTSIILSNRRLQKNARFELGSLLAAKQIIPSIGIASNGITSGIIELNGAHGTTLLSGTYLLGQRFYAVPLGARLSRSGLNKTSIVDGAVQAETASCDDIRQLAQSVIWADVDDVSGPDQ